MTERNPPPAATKADDEIAKLLAGLRGGFIESAGDHIATMDQNLAAFEKGEKNAEEALHEINRELHNIKGQGATFGFPVTGRVAHMLEDFLLNANGIREDNIADIRFHLDLMDRMLTTSEPIEEEARHELYKSLPLGRRRSFTEQSVRDVNLLLVMPAGLQRKMVAKELVNCGFRVMRAYDCLEAVSVANDIKPDMVFLNYNMTPFTGRELCNVFHAIDKLRDIRIVLLTSYGVGDEHVSNLPKTVSVVQKQRDFIETLGQLLIDQGLFGDLGA